MPAPLTPPAPLDLAQFDGHTPGPWVCLNRNVRHYEVDSEGFDLRPRRVFAYAQRGEPKAVDGLLAEMAPTLLAEVKRLRESESRLLASEARLVAALALVLAHPSPGGLGGAYITLSGDDLRTARAAQPTHAAPGQGVAE